MVRCRLAINVSSQSMSAIERSECRQCARGPGRAPLTLRVRITLLRSVVSSVPLARVTSRSRTRRSLLPRYGRDRHGHIASRTTRYDTVYRGPAGMPGTSLANYTPCTVIARSTLSSLGRPWHVRLTLP